MFSAGMTTGGMAASGGMAAGGMATGGVAAGGMATGGVAAGGMAMGGVAGGAGTYPVASTYPVAGGMIQASGEADCTAMMCATGTTGAGVCSGTGTGACMGMACGTGAGCEVATGPAVMTFVGAGGDYVTETSYKYVGKGAGIYSMVTPKRSLVGYYICVISVVVLVVLAVLLWPKDTTTTTPMTTSFSFTTTPSTTQPTTTPAPPPRRSCVFWGDPHIITFDGARPSFYGEGEFWIIKSPTVHIQGRYMGTKYTHGLSATNKVVIGGPFMHGHKIEVGTLESGELTVDGNSVLTSFPSSYTLPHGLGTVTYSSQGRLVDRATSRWPKRAVHMSLHTGVQITVFRWKNYLDLQIEMTQIDGMDGACGNFNLNPSDDTTRQIMRRVGVRVAPGASMFTHEANVVVTPEMATMIQRDCPEQTRSEAHSLCQKQMPGAVEQKVLSCVFDQCFGMLDHAQQTAKRYD